MDKIGKSGRNNYEDLGAPKNSDTVKNPKLEPINSQAPILNAPRPLPVFLNGPHAANFKNLTVESHEAAEKRFPQKEKQNQAPETTGLWNKAKAALWGGISCCADWVGVKLSSGEIQQASKIASAGRKIQAGMTHVWSTQNLFNLTRSSKTHLDYGLSALSAASGLYKFIVKHGKDGAKHAKVLQRIDATTRAFENAHDELETVNARINLRLEHIKEKAARRPDFKQELAKKVGLLAQIEAELKELKNQGNALDDNSVHELEATQHRHGEAQMDYKNLLYRIEADLPGIPLKELRGEQELIKESIERSDADITQLLHEAYALSKRECITTTLLQVSGGKSVATGVKTATYYGSNYSSLLSEHSKEIKGYLDNYLMIPIFITGLSVSLYGSYTLGKNINNRSEIEAHAQKMLSKPPEDPELEAFVSLVASKQRTTQALLSLGSSLGKAAQNALALGVAFGGISLASAATGISEEVLHTVITPVGWAIGGGVACTSLGLKAYQNYQEANRQQEETYWIQILHESNANAPIASLSEDYKDLAEMAVKAMKLEDSNGSPMEDCEAARSMIDSILKNQAILSLMKLNVDFAVGIIIARLTSSDEGTAKSTAYILEELGLQDTDIEDLIKMSPQVASGALKEKLCLL